MNTRILSVLSLAAMLPAVPATSLEIDGFVGVRGLLYEDDGGTSRPERALAFSGQVETDYVPSDAIRLSLRAFGRFEPEEEDGTYWDLPIAKLTYFGEAWQADVGFDTVFWGRAESQRVVNIINQPDLIRSLRADVTLGQPMAALRWFGDVVTLEGYVLPFFRERKFGGDAFREGTPLPVDSDRSTFEDPDGSRHVDYAARISTVLGDFEGGLSLFTGTLRNPRFDVDAERQVLVPRYVIGDQVGLDAQYTRGSTLFKLESKHVDPRGENAFTAAVGGIEQVFGALLGGNTELFGFIEYNYDSRGTDGPSIYQNDIFIGTRINFSNVLDTNMNAGIFVDLEHGSSLGRVALDTRLTDALRLTVDAYVFEADDPDDALFSARNADQVAVALRWFF